MQIREQNGIVEGVIYKQLLLFFFPLFITLLRTTARLSQSGVCAVRILWVFLVVPRWHELNVLMLSYPVSWAIT